MYVSVLLLGYCESLKISGSRGLENWSDFNPGIQNWSGFASLLHTYANNRRNKSKNKTKVEHILLHTLEKESARKRKSGLSLRLALRKS